VAARAARSSRSASCSASAGRGRRGGAQATGYLLGGLLGLFFVWLWGGARSFDKHYPLPLHLCPTCRPKVRRGRQIKACLQKVDVYARLLEKHPYAEVKIS
jgi:hypothetical protein